MYFYKREMFNWNKVLMQTWSPIDRGRKGFIEYTIIPWRRLNRQVTLAVYFFYVSHRFPVEHVQTPGGQTTFEAWKPFIVGALFLSILLIVFFFLPVKICRDLSAGYLLPLSSLLSCTVRAMAINCLFGMWDRFPLEHVHTPGRQLPVVTLSWVLNNSLPLSDRFPVEQVHTPGGQTASCSDEKVWNDFSLSVTGPALMK